MKNIFKVLAVSSAIFAVGLPNVVSAGSTIGGVPSNGGGVTFAIPGGGAVQDAIASGNPVQIEAALIAAIAANYPGGFESVDLDPLPNTSGLDSVAILTNLILEFARAIGLDPATSPAIQQMLAMAETAIT